MAQTADHLFKRTPDGPWYVRLPQSFGPDGRPKQGARSTGTTSLREAIKIRDEILTQSRSGSLVQRPSSFTFGSYLEEWLQAKEAAGTYAPTSLELWRGVVRNHLVPGLGRWRLRDLSPEALNAFYVSEPRRRLGKGRGGPLSPTTIVDYHRVLKTILDDAVDSGLIAKNPARARSIRLPRAKAKSGQAMDLAESDAFLMATPQVKEGRYFCLFALAVVAGLRAGELLGLRWQDVQFTNDGLAVLQVRQQRSRKRPAADPFAPLKTRTSEADLPLGPVATAVLRKEQARVEAMRRSAGPFWTDLDLVFPTSKGTAQSWSNVRRDGYGPAISLAGLADRNFRPHDLRHTMATQAVEEAAMDAARERARHGSASMTRHYVHTRLTKALDALLLGRVAERLALD